MNRRQFVLKVSIIAIAVLSNTVSFGMIVRYKDEQSKKAVQASIASCLKSLNEKEQERIRALPLEEQGQHNLEKLYKNRHKPEFVQRFLSDENNYVPVMLVHKNVNAKEGKGIKRHFFKVDPYHKSFYDPNDDVDLGFDSDRDVFYDPYKRLLSHEKISKIGEKRSRKALQQKRTECSYKNPSVYKIVCDDGNNRPLVTASLFGNDEDIQRELRDKVPYNYRRSNGIRDMHAATLASINYPNKKNNALELLLPKLKQKAKKKFFGNSLGADHQARVILSHSLLGASTDNKEIFELIAQKDPYGGRRISAHNPFYAYGHQGGYGDEECTILDLMIKDEKHFGKDNIQTFIDNGGCSAKTLDVMEYVGNIIEHLPNRRHSMTPEERMESDHFDRLTYNTLRQREMERNQQLNILDVTEPDVD